MLLFFIATLTNKKKTKNKNKTKQTNKQTNITIKPKRQNHF